MKNIKVPISSVQVNNLDTSNKVRGYSFYKNAKIFASFILKNFSQCMINEKFPNQSRKEGLSSVFKNGNYNGKSSSRLFSIISK